MSIVSRFLNRFVGLIRKRKTDDFFLSDLVISKQDQARYEEWAKKKNEMVRQKYRSKGK
jgi:hypothetical protein